VPGQPPALGLPGSVPTCKCACLSGHSGGATDGVRLQVSGVGYGYMSGYGSSKDRYRAMQQARRSARQEEDVESRQSACMWLMGLFGCAVAKSAGKEDCGDERCSACGGVIVKAGEENPLSVIPTQVTEAVTTVDDDDDDDGDDPQPEEIPTQLDASQNDSLPFDDGNNDDNDDDYLDDVSLTFPSDLKKQTAAHNAAHSTAQRDTTHNVSGHPRVRRPGNDAATAEAPPTSDFFDEIREKRMLKRLPYHLYDSQ